MKQYLEAGEFVTTHGITGELRLYPWADGPEFLERFERLFLDAKGEREIRLARVRRHKNIAIAKIEGVDSIEAARPYIGRTVYIAREDVQLEAGHHFVQDLLGLLVVDVDTGEEYGRIGNITRPGRHDVYEVTREGAAPALFPATQPFLVGVELDAGRVLVRPIPGMFNEEEQG